MRERMYCLAVRNHVTGTDLHRADRSKQYASLADARARLASSLAEERRRGVSGLLIDVALVRAARAEPGQVIRLGNYDHWLEEAK